jgi:tRNA-dependent cyclodipeptide synthase
MIKAKAAGAKSAWQSHIGGKGYMGVSLHSPNHRGNSLAAMVRWVNETGKFDEFKVGLSDTLNRHNYVMEEGISYEQAAKKASCIGQEWLDENLSILENLEIPYELVRWDYWLHNYSDVVESNRASFYQAFNNNQSFRESILDDVRKYFNRHHGVDLSNADPDKIGLSIEYLIEELAVYSVIFDTYPSTAIYPGKQLACFELIRNGDVLGDIPLTIKESKFIRLALHGAEPAWHRDPTPEQANKLHAFEGQRKLVV